MEDIKVPKKAPVEPIAPEVQKPTSPDFGDTISKAISRPWKNKALWFYGVLIAIFAGGSFNPGSQNLGNINPNDMTKPFAGIPTSTIIAVVALLSVFVLVFVVLGLIVGSWALAATINGNIKIENGEAITRKEIGKTGRGPVWGLIKLNFFVPLLITLGVLAVVGILAGIGFAVPQPAGAIIAFSIGGLLFVAALPFLVYFGIVWLMAARFVVVENQKTWQAIGSARALLKGNWWLTFLLSFVAGIISGCGGCLGSIVFFIFLIAAIGFIVAKLYMVAAVMGVLALVGLIVLLIVAGYFRAFTESALTIWWSDLKKIKS